MFGWHISAPGCRISAAAWIVSMPTSAGEGFDWRHLETHCHHPFPCNVHLFYGEKHTLLNMYLFPLHKKESLLCYMCKCSFRNTTRTVGWRMRRERSWTARTERNTLNVDIRIVRKPVGATVNTYFVWQPPLNYLAAATWVSGGRHIIILRPPLIYLASAT